MARAWTLRFVFGSDRSKSISATLILCLHFALRTGETLFQRRVAEIGKCIPACGDFKGPIAVVRHRSNARAAPDGNRLSRKPDHLLGYLTERMCCAGGNVD